MNKLIEPIVRSEHTPIFDIVYKRELEELEQINNEMLDIVIKYTMQIEKIYVRNKSDKKGLIHFNELCQHEIGIIEKEGYISNYNLIKEFKVTHGVHVEAYFEAMNNPLYDEKIPISQEEKRRNHNYRQKHTKIWKLLNPVFDEWKQEAKIVNGYSNNYAGNMTGRLF